LDPDTDLLFPILIVSETARRAVESLPSAVPRREVVEKTRIKGGRPTTRAPSTYQFLRMCCLPPLHITPAAMITCLTLLPASPRTSRRTEVGQ
ncbi:uncharacterized protein BT62DRAFT_936636, partial [Guyanagaster necrorhizus]